MSDALHFLIQAILYIPVRIAFFIFARVRIKGKENLKGVDRSKGIIFVANHRNQVDGFLLTTSLPIWRDFFPLYITGVRPEYIENKPVGKFLYNGFIFWILGIIPLTKGLKNYAKSLSRHTELLRRGRSLLIFPEGRRMFDGTMGEAHGGAAYLAHVSGATIIPVGLSNTTGLRFTKFFAFSRVLGVRFGKPFTFREVDIAPTAPEPVRYKEAATQILARVEPLIDVLQ